MLTGNLNATRFAQQPLPQPSYSFGNVPLAVADLKGSSLQFVDRRDAFHACMAEMLLLCKEAMRRRRSSSSSSSHHSKQHTQHNHHGGSKPLSLEYLADRCDVDDPIFGFLVRTNENPHASSRTTSNSNALSQHWKAGMLQGFITVTTFTNYQASFRWDSLNEAAYSYDEHEMALQRANGQRKWDADGKLAQEMQALVRCGDVWNEGIVWPHIAEISLLGGLGCGRALVSLVIEHLECMKASGKSNYDYVVLQATDNSISFYESMGFVRVGAVAKEENLSGNSPTNSNGNDRSSTSSSSEENSDEEVVAEPLPDDSPEKPNAIARTLSSNGAGNTTSVVTSELTSYTIKKAGEMPSDIAKKCKVDVWDIVFLNKAIFPELIPSSRLLEGTVLHIPVTTTREQVAPSSSSSSKPAAVSKKSSARLNNNNSNDNPNDVDVPQWYVAKENETPRMIARKFELSCLDLVNANKGRLAGLMSNSRLKEGTRLKISHLEVHEGEYKPYAHWSFPDDQFEDGEPSYMMARRLNRRRGNASRHKPFLESLAVEISEYQPTPLVLPPSPPIGASAASADPTGAGAVATKTSKKRQRHPDEPMPPKRPLTAYMVFLKEQRETCQDQYQGITIAKATRMIADQWHALQANERVPYEAVAREQKTKYFEAKARYEKELEAFLSEHPGLSREDSSSLQQVAFANPAGLLPLTVSKPGKHTLYNKVVRLKPGAMTEGSAFTYWYVLTFIPDLKWCHLAPMIQVGTFGTDQKRKSSHGRPKWKLLDESHGKEVDISSSFCIPIKSRSMKKTLDADKEEWDILDDGGSGVETLPDEAAMVAHAHHQHGVVSRGSIAAYDYSYPGTTPGMGGGVPVRTSTAMKPSAERKKKRKFTTADLPRLVAAYPNPANVGPLHQHKETFLRLEGSRLYDPTFGYSSTAAAFAVADNCKRLKGSKTKLKTPPGTTDDLYLLDTKEYKQSKSTSRSGEKVNAATRAMQQIPLTKKKRKKRHCKGCGRSSIECNGAKGGPIGGIRNCNFKKDPLPASMWSTSPMNAKAFSVDVKKNNSKNTSGKRRTINKAPKTKRSAPATSTQPEELQDDSGDDKEVEQQQTVSSRSSRHAARASSSAAAHSNDDTDVAPANASPRRARSREVSSTDENHPASAAIQGVSSASELQQPIAGGDDHHHRHRPTRSSANYNVSPLVSSRRARVLERASVEGDLPTIEESSDAVNEDGRATRSRVVRLQVPSDEPETKPKKQGASKNASTRRDTVESVRSRRKLCTSPLPGESSEEDDDYVEPTGGDEDDASSSSPSSTSSDDAPPPPPVHNRRTRLLRRTQMQQEQSQAAAGSTTPLQQEQQPPPGSSNHKRKASDSSMFGSLPRKRRKVNSAGSRRSVLQN